MNLRLLLVDDDGNVLEAWNVDQDFGDLSKPLPRAELVNVVAAAVEEAKKD